MFTGGDIFAQLQDPRPAKIRDGLYLGGLGALKSIQRLEITHVLSVMDMSPEWNAKMLDEEVKIDSKHHMVIPVSDLASSNLLSHMADAVDFIENAVSTGGTALVHCMAGVSRSSTMVAAYLMKAENLTRDEALADMRTQRPCVMPNPGFLEQLQQWHASGCKGPSRNPPTQPPPKRAGIDKGSSGMQGLMDQLMANEPSLIRPGLYVGGLRSLKKVRYLKVTHILSALDMSNGWTASIVSNSEFQPHVPKANRMEIAVEDLANVDLLSHFPGAVSFIKRARSGGGTVLVHCMAGVSRSVSLVVAYLMQEEGLSRDEALASVKKSRTCADPNWGFMEQLRRWEDMGCRFEADSPTSQRKALDELSERALADANGRPNLMTGDLMPSPSDSQGQVREEAVLARRQQFHDRLAWQKHVHAAGGTGNDESSLFVNPMKYMENGILGRIQGKLYCPKCNARLGSFNWAGMRNSKGTLVTPAFQLHLSRLDKMLSQERVASPSRI